MEPSLTAVTAAERRVASVPWEALAGLSESLDGPIAEMLAGKPAERVLDRLLRALGEISGPSRTAVAEAVFGVGLWRRRLLAQLALPDAPPRLLLAALVRDLGQREDAAALCALEEDRLPRRALPPEALADRYSLPDWLATELLHQGADCHQLADALCQPGPISLRPNLLRTTYLELAARLAEEGLKTRPGTLLPSALKVAGRPNLYGSPSHQAGLFEVQDEASQLVGALVGARPGEEVLDACAGAGGKSLLLAALVGASGRVHATDPDLERLRRLDLRALRAGAAEMIQVHRAGMPPSSRVDRALVDAPCSELGTLRRGPDLRWRIDPASFAPLPALQLQILEGASRHLRPGGRLVYATCTFREEEDEAVAFAFERSHPEFRRQEPEAPPSTVTPEGFFRTWPHRHGADAFFAAVWERSR